MIKLNIHILRNIFNGLTEEERKGSSISGFLFQNNIRLIPGNPQEYTLALEFRSDKEETIFKLKYAEYL